MKKLLPLLAIIILSCADDATTPPTNPCGTMPSGATNDSVRIVALVPNPAGDDDRSENWTVKCFGASADLANYKITDADNVEWAMSGTLTKCDSTTFVSDKTAQMRNTGESIRLKRVSDGATIQVITYGEVTDGQIIRP